MTWPWLIVNVRAGIVRPRGARLLSVLAVTAAGLLITPAIAGVQPRRTSAPQRGLWSSSFVAGKRA
jgi:hypothetical protein